MIDKDLNTTEEITRQTSVEMTSEIVVPISGGAETPRSRERWHRKVEFLFTCIGFAVGYGNFWRFPFFGKVITND